MLNEAPASALGDCSEAAGICCRNACGLPTRAFSPPCVHGHSCRNTQMPCVDQVIRCNPAVCCANSKPPLYQHQENGDHTYISHARGDCNSHNRYKGSRSPSPPPLSPKPVDLDYKIAVKSSSIFHIQECKAPNIAPPSLLPHRFEDEETSLHSNTPDGCCEKVVTLHTQAEKDDHQCGSFIGDFMDRVTEKLKSIQPSEKPQNLPAHASQISKTRDDTHLTEIITTVLHNSSDKDYNLNELLQQHVATEQRSPQTRSRKRLETLVAMSKSSDHSSSRRQSLQIKRHLARFSPSYFKRNTGFERDRCAKTVKPLQLTYSLVEQPQCRKLNRTVCTEPAKDTLENLTTHAQSEKTKHTQEPHLQHIVLKEPLPTSERELLHETDHDQKVKAKIHKEKSLTVHVGRTRRNIVPPQRFSSYVTEPRKMYFAACFSESIFTKHSSRDSMPTALSSTEEIPMPSDKCGTLNIALPKEEILSQEEPLVECENKESSRKRKSCQTSTLPLKKSKCSRANSLNTESHHLTISNFTTTESTPQAESSLPRLKYDSPIKLMFVSSVTGEDGVKYTLKAAASGSESHCEMFDPCVESSWAGCDVDDHNEDSVLESAVENGGNKCTSQNVVSLDAYAEPSFSINEGENQEPLPVVHQTTPVKRRPGRPKKIGPHIVKSVKRPIGRPPKPKKTDPSSPVSTPGSNAVIQTTTEISPVDDGNKNLKITILYGRSRRVRRVVSEDLGGVPAEQHVNEESDDSLYSKTSTNDQTTKDQFKDLDFIMPIEDRKCIHSSCNIKCQRQSDITMSRKPGRPPKVKISGISVTVTAGSPGQRKIHIKRDTKDKHLLRRTLLLGFQPSKEQKTICIPADIKKDPGDAPKEHNQSTRGLIPVRHSVRERKPSIHLLHSVATARSCALVRRSRKLLLNKACCEASQHAKNIEDESTNNALSIKAKNVSCVKDIVRFSAVSVDSIFSPQEGFRWWPTSASPETLNEELARRIKMMSDTWVSDVPEANKSEEISTDPKPKTCEEITEEAPKKSASAIKMLFEKNYNMEKLCSWFMQSTETQSLAIVKKTTSRNPKDVFHYSLSRPNCKMNVCPSPQAERLRKHVKKFAKVVPKSPSMHKRAQEMLSKSARSHVKRKLFDTSSCKHQISLSRSIWLVYRTTLLRAQHKFKTRHKTTLPVEASGVKPDELLKEMPNLVNKSFRPVQNALKLLLKTPQKMIGLSNISKQNRISSKAWSPESLKECSVFLKKINSPNTKSMTEECNICTVKLYDVSEQEGNEDVTVERTLISPVKSQRNGGRKRGKQKSPSPSSKPLRQSRSSRGVLGARWCDFVLGSLK